MRDVEAELEAHGLTGLSIRYDNSFFAEKKEQFFNPGGKGLHARPADRDEECRSFNIFNGSGRILPVREAYRNFDR